MTVFAFKGQKIKVVFDGNTAKKLFDLNFIAKNRCYTPQKKAKYM